MDKRFLAWLLISASLFILWINLRQRFAPPIEDPTKLNQPLTLEQEKVPGSREAQSEMGSDSIGESKPSRELEDDGKPDAPKVSNPSWHVLGTQLPNDNYRLMVTLSSRGAGIERIELVEQPQPGRFRYRSLQGKGGYLGYLALQPIAGGLVVQSVPIGSPAAMAKPRDLNVEPGLQVGDKIVSIHDESVSTLSDWHVIFEKLKPGNLVSLEVERVASNDSSVSRLVFEVELVEAPMDVVRVVDENLEETVAGNLLRNSCLTTIAKLDDEAIPTGRDVLKGMEATLNGHWFSRELAVEEGSGIEFYLPLRFPRSSEGGSSQLEIVKRYRLRKGGQGEQEWQGYELELETAVRNLDDRDHEISFRQEGFNGLTLEGWWYLSKISPHFFEGAGARDVVYASDGQGHQMVTRRAIYKEAYDNPKQPSRLFITPEMPSDRRSLKYLGVDAQFFAAAILPHPEQPDSLKNIRFAATMAVADTLMVPKTKQQAMNVSNWLETPVVKVPAKGEYRHRYQLFAGPKDPDLLERHGLGSFLEYGWFGGVAKPLTWILHTFYAISRNYGIAIIMLTVMVRSMMFPLSRRAAMSGQRMQEMAPEIKRVTELYKDDWEKRSKATQEIYKKYKFNPMAGCLPVFIQLPIFMGLYRALSVDVQLRQQPLIPGLDWCQNLAGPDMLLDWSTWMPEFIAGKGTGWFGPYLNLLPIITIALFIIQQKVLMPKATDEQQQMTQTMMMYMTVFMGVLFFKVPAGLCIYFITSSTWSLVERKLIKKFTPPIKPGLSVEPALESPKLTGNEAKPSQPQNRPRSQASQRPEKLSDVFPWLAKFGDRPDKPESSSRDETRNSPNRSRPKPRKKK